MKTGCYTYSRSATLTTVLLFCLSLASCAVIKNFEAAGEFDQGIALFNRGKFKEALPHFERATEIDPSYYNAYLYIGRCYLGLKQFTNAVQPLRTAYKLCPDSFKSDVFDVLLDALIGAATWELKEGNMELTISYLNEALALNPRSDKAKDEIARTYIATAGSLLKDGKIEEAIKSYSEALKASPNSITAYLGLATAFVRSGNISRAIDAAEKAHILDPNNAEILRVLRELIGK